MTTCLDCGDIVSVGPRCNQCASDLRLIGGDHYSQARLAGEILQRLYDAEANGAIRWFWDGGFEWECWGRSDIAAGSDGHGYLLITAVTAFAECVAKQVPDGQFAKWWATRGRG